MVENGSLARSLGKLGPLAIQKIKIYIFNKCAVDTVIMTVWLVGFAHLSDLLLFGYITCSCFETSLLSLSEAVEAWGRKMFFFFFFPPILLSVLGSFFRSLCF